MYSMDFWNSPKDSWSYIGNGALGAIDYTDEERRKLAKESTHWSCPVCGLAGDLLPPLKEEITSTTVEEGTTTTYADQIALMHVHGLKEESEEKSKDEQQSKNDDNSSVESPAEKEETKEEQEQVCPTNNKITHSSDNSTTETRSSSPDWIDSVLYYVVVALVVALVALVYRKMLQIYGVIPSTWIQDHLIHNSYLYPLHLAS